MSSTVLNQRKLMKRYLPGIRLPDNIMAIPDIETVAMEADILIFNFPHQVFVCGFSADYSLPLKYAPN